jgi:hypothetical protein
MLVHVVDPFHHLPNDYRCCFLTEGLVFLQKVEERTVASQL